MDQQTITLLSVGSFGLVIILTLGWALIKFLAKDKWQGVDSRMNAIETKLANLEAEVQAYRRETDARITQLLSKTLSKDEAKELRASLAALNTRIDDLFRNGRRSGP